MPADPHPQKRILLIDDDVDHLDLCQLILERNGYEVRTLHHPDMTMEVIMAFNPDLIFVDHNMHEFTGTETTKLIKSHPAAKHIPVIYFSSCDDIVKRAEEAGADGHLEKPFEFANFLETARKYLYTNSFLPL